MEPIEEVIARVGDSDPKKASKANARLSGIVARAGKPGNEGSRALVARALASELVATAGKDDKGNESKAPKHSAAVRGKLCRHLAAVASAKEVPALEQALGDLDTREMARWALDRVDCVEATEALVDVALNDVGPEFRVGVINALGKKTGPAVLEALRTCATEKSEPIRAAAAEALSNHAVADNDAVICRVAGSQQDRVVAQMAKARIRLAENLVRAGETKAGKRIYQGILANDPAESQRRAVQSALDQLG